MIGRLLVGCVVLVLVLAAPSTAFHTGHLDSLQSELADRESGLTGDLDKDQKKEKKSYTSCLKLCTKPSNSLAGDIKAAGKVVGKLKKLIAVDPTLDAIADTALDGLEADTGSMLDAIQVTLNGAPEGKKKDKAQGTLDAARTLLAAAAGKSLETRGVVLKKRAKGLSKAEKTGQKAAKLTAKALAAGGGGGGGGGGGKCIWSETWAKASTGSYSPTKGDGRKLSADHTWYVNDTVSEFPDCGSSPHTAKIISRDGGKLMRLTSVLANNDCADNIWIITLLSGVKIAPGTKITFRANTYLGGMWGKWANYYFHRIRLVIQDTRGNELHYTLAHREIDVLQAAGFKELFPVPDSEGRYSRDLHADFSQITGFVSGTKIRHIGIDVDSDGWVEVDNICISKN